MVESSLAADVAAIPSRSDFGPADPLSRFYSKSPMADGFVLVSVKGSHHKYARHEGDCVRTVIVPHPKRDLPTGTARAIARQAGWIE